MQKRPGLRAARVFLWIAIVGWMVYGLVVGWRRTAELYALSSGGRAATAQVIGCEPVPAGQQMGFVKYSFNDGSKAITNQFQVPVTSYKNYPIGQPIAVTYLPSESHTVRIGSVSSGSVMRSIIIAAVFLISGLLAFGLLLAVITALISTPPSGRTSG